MSAPSKSRVRTEVQLKQKRLVDRVKHRENRQQTKLQLQRIEEDILHIRQTLESINTHLLNQTLGHNLSLHPRPLDSSQTGHNGISPLLRRRPRDFYAQRITLSGIAMQQTQITAVPSLRLSCRCGMEHSDNFEDIQHCSITTLYQSQVTMPQAMPAITSLPRNPPLSSMMLHSEGDNFVTSLMTPFLRGIKTGKIETLLGTYLFAYRLIRWQLEPNQSTLTDVPSWLMPTAAQMSYPHPVCFNFLPWPRLRDFLCSYPETGSLHSVKLYFDSITLELPSGCELFASDDEGKITITESFEKAALNLENWHMGPPWADVFPQLVYLVA